MTTSATAIHPNTAANLLDCLAASISVFILSSTRNAKIKLATAAGMAKKAPRLDKQSDTIASTRWFSILDSLFSIIKTPSSKFFPLPERERTQVRVLKHKYAAVNLFKTSPFRGR